MANSEISIKFFGACGTVTGSRFLVECGEDNILIDCGMFQGERETKNLNWQPFPHPPQDVKRIAVTHSHIDHTGYMPRLVRNGFNGKIHCTRATGELLNILLPDAAMIQEEDAAFYNRKRLSRHEKALPLYTSLDAKRTLAKIINHKHSEVIHLSDNFQLEFKIIGHILGANMILLTVKNRGKDLRILFSGDIGRYGIPILKDPVNPPDADVLLIESTYGDRLHPKAPTPRDQLAEVVNRIAMTTGVLLIPAFAVGRTQEILYHLRVLELEGKIPAIPVYIDSPMAIDVTELYLRHHECFDREMIEHINEDGQFLNPKYFHMVRSPAESRKLNSQGGPSIIVSASGMLSGGRIRHHLYHKITNPANELLFVGYQAKGTRGRSLVEGAKTIHVFKEELAVRARVSMINGFSAHADYEEMLKWVSGMKTPPKQIFVVHGEDEVRPVFAEKLRLVFPDSEINIPAIDDSYLLD
jgi:metallo-beta-lactamase family protein